MIFNSSLIKSHLKTLKETSEDDGVFMVSSQDQVIDFDGVKDEYFKKIKDKCEAVKYSDGKIRKGCTPASADALFFIEDDRLIFVEFKNGIINGDEKRSIRKKLYDSLLIYGDLEKKLLSYFQDNAEFILVYNKGKNAGKLKNGVEIEHSQTSSSSIIAKHVLNLAKKELILFDLEKFQGFCYNKIHTFDVDEMNNWLNSHKIRI